jgi:hypothetical protein
MNFSLPGGTLTLISSSNLDKIKRYQECIGNFACEISGRDAKKCVAAISPMTQELETRADGSFRIHKPTEPQARLIQQLAMNWVASSPDSREVTAFPVSTDHSAQQAKDASNVDLTGSCAGTFRSGLAITGGPWSVNVELDENGAVREVSLTSGSAAPAKAAPVAPPTPEPVIQSPREAVEAVVALSMESLRTSVEEPTEEAQKAVEAEDKKEAPESSPTKTPRKRTPPRRKPSKSRNRPGKGKK